MASPECLDLAALLEPIPGDAPCGPDLREDPDPDSSYRRLFAAWKAAREAARRVPESEEEDLGGASEWRPIWKQAPVYLTERSKDLDVAAWLIDAAPRLHGFAGLRDGFRLARELIERYWDELHPRPEDDIGDRVRMLGAIFQSSNRPGDLTAAIRLIPITAETAAGEFNTYEIGAAQETQANADDATGASPMDAVQAAFAASPIEFLKDLRDDVRLAKAEFEQLTSALDERCGIELSPPSSGVNEVLGSALDAVELLTRDLIPLESEPVAASSTEPSGSDSAPPAAPSAPAAQPGEVCNREDAFDALERVAAFFRRAEPHSPVPYLLAQAIRWGRMPLPTLVQELMADEEAKSTYYWLTGARNTNE